MSATLLRAFRSQYRLSQGELGLLVGRSRSSVAAYEAGTQEPDGAVVGLLRMLEGRPPAEILARVSANRSPAEQSPGDEVAMLQHFLLEDGISKSAPIRPDDPDSEWRFQRGAASKKFNLATLERLAVVPASDGGYLTGETTRAGIGPLAISSRLSRLGTTFAGVDSTLSDFHTAILSDPACYWVNEGEVLPVSQVSLASVSGSYKTVGTSLALSRRLLRQAGPSGLRAFGQAMTRSLARELDRACLAGTGTPTEPMGVIHSPGIPTIDAEATTFDAAFWQGIRTLEENGINSESLSVVAHPRTVEKLRALTDISAVIRDWEIERGRQTFRGYQSMSTPNCPEGSLLIGDFSQITVRLANQIDLRVLDGLRPDGAHLVYGFLDAAIENPYADKAFLVIENVFAS